MDKKQIALMAVDALKAEYPDAICSLVYTDPLQLLIATRLAAQCTDARVNIVTPALFERFKTAQDFADSTPEEVAEYIRGLTKYQRLLLRTRISRHQMAAGYEASHLEGIGKQDIQRRILLSEFWKMLVKVAAPCFK